MKTWLITGCSSGFGRILAEAVLTRGDRAMLTARDTASIANLVERFPQTARVAQLDVTQADDIRNVIKQTELAFGGLDILVNNAGYGLVGAVEETDPSEYRPMFEANVFGSIEMVRAALPLLRQTEGPRRIVQFSSVGGMNGRPGFGLYAATKFAVEGVSEALSHEVEPFGISVIIVEPGAFRTSFLGRSLTVAKNQIAAYDKTAGATREFSGANDGQQMGDPIKGIAVLLEAIDAEKPPLRLALGADAYQRIRAKIAGVAADLEAWEASATATAHEG